MSWKTGKGNSGFQPMRDWINLIPSNNDLRISFTQNSKSAGILEKWFLTRTKHYGSEHKTVCFARLRAPTPSNIFHYEWIHRERRWKFMKYTMPKGTNCGLEPNLDYTTSIKF